MTENNQLFRSKKALFCFFVGLASWIGLFSIWCFERGEGYYFERIMHTTIYIPIAVAVCTLGFILAALGWIQDKANGKGVSAIGIFGCILSASFVAYGFYLENLINGPLLKQLFHFK